MRRAGLVALAFSLAGCGTMTNLTDAPSKQDGGYYGLIPPCQAFGGVKYGVEMASLGSWEELPARLPLTALALADLPGSFVCDTLVLPLTLYWAIYPDKCSAIQAYIDLVQSFTIKGL